MRELLVVLLLAGADGREPTKLGAGRRATPEEVKTRDITVLPNGSGLPSGRGTARHGRALYAAHCALCHGVRGEGQGDYPNRDGFVPDPRPDVIRNR